MGLDTSPEHPAAVRTVAQGIAGWVARLGQVWVDGQVAQLSRRPGAPTVWITLRDTDADMSLTVVTRSAVVDAVSPPLAEGQRVVLLAKPEFWTGRGQLQLRASEIRPVGLGALLAELERLKGLLAAEGLFAAERKRPLPFLPRRVGLVCGRNSAAMRDVLVNARARWPAVDFEVREVAVQGVQAVSQVVAALQELDALPDVDVVIVTRGGGGVEDLLPFSNEALVRAVAACRTPVVSAIGHEQDTPLVDLVADLRASTPTDAAKRVVPDHREETERIASGLARVRRAWAQRVAGEERWLADVRRRPALSDPDSLLASRRSDVEGLAQRALRAVDVRVDRAVDDLEHVRARVRALSPAATLDRGYAVVQTEAGAVVRDPAQVETGDDVRIRVSGGAFGARRT
ncbi:MAG: exodeoxyribonuclease VII large subunit [Candidatus Nanopelagicales bacterium]